MKLTESIKNYFSGVWQEAKKIIWPSRKQVTNDTTTVIISVLIAMIIFGAIDFLLTIGLEKILLQGR